MRLLSASFSGVQWAHGAKALEQQGPFTPFGVFPWESAVEKSESSSATPTP